MVIDATYTPTGMDISYVHDKKFYLEHFPVSQYPNQFPIWEVCHPNDALPGWLNWDDRPVKLKYAKKFNLFDRIQFLNKLPEEHFNRIHGYSEVPLLSVDFEMEISESGGFPEAEDVYDKKGKLLERGAQTPIVSAAITKDDDYLTTTLMTIDEISEDDIKKINEIVDEYLTPYNAGRKCKINVIRYPDERSMLNGYLELTKNAIAITGWNFTGYDMPYLKNRLKVYGMDMSKASIKGTVDHRGNPTHTFIEDYMELFKEKSSWLIPNCERFSLDYVSKHLVGLGKLPKPKSLTDPNKEMTLRELRIHDLPRFLAYNIIDTALVQLIHRAINTMAAVYQLASLSFTSLKECLSPVQHSTGIMIKYFLDNNPGVVVALAEKVKERKYPGAFVKDPIRHFARALACYDYSSLYPSLIKTHNLSPANFIKKLNPKTDNIAELMKDPNLTVTSTGSLYKNDKDYFFKIVQSMLYDLRKSWDNTSTEMIQKCILPLDEELNKRGISKEQRLQ